MYGQLTWFLGEQRQLLRSCACLLPSYAVLPLLRHSPGQRPPLISDHYTWAWMPAVLCTPPGWRPPQEHNHQPATSAATIINDRLSHMVVLFPGEPAGISVYDSSCDDHVYGRKVQLASFPQVLYSCTGNAGIMQASITFAS